MRRITLSLFLCFCAVGRFEMRAQQAPAGSIAGVVLDAATKDPIRRAIVRLSTVGDNPQDAVAWTDSNGRFAFGFLQAGRYQLVASKDGYAASLFGRETTSRLPAVIKLAAGENRVDFVFRLEHPATISGTVFDEDGEPLPGVPVNAMRQGFIRGEKQLMPGPSAATDVHGHYTVSIPGSGKYVLVTRHVFQNTMKAQAEVSATQQQRQYVYTEQFYPGTDQESAAVPLTVNPGVQIKNIDFRMTARPALTLRGHVALPPGVPQSAQVNVNLYQPGIAYGLHLGAMVMQPNFEFTFGNLGPTTYVLMAHLAAEGKEYQGLRRVDVTDQQPVQDVAITLDPAKELSGQVTITGPDAAKHHADTVSLTPHDRTQSPQQNLQAKVNPDGTFHFSNVPTGVWDIGPGPIPRGGYIKSMSLGDKDVLTEKMEITASNSAPLKIVIGTRGAVLTADVTDANDQPVRAELVLAPDGKFHHVFSFYRVAITDDEGHFKMNGLTPGTYKIYAFDESPGQVGDPDLLTPYEQLGTALELKDAEETSVKLHLIPVKKEGQQ
ncbi:MAG TPA: carboxypeptidase regulatory-like domain-containing protein [Bryobacteraceae bacterium]|nr:carboxypeptidase regulatory-like domain-containing protein [Bryobacteraceae bacterium]